MKLKRTFVGGKMNKDLDERLLPSGEYPHAENIQVANTDTSDVGVIENVKGNYPLTSLGLREAQTIGAYADESNQKLYWFVTSLFKDMVLEFDYVLKRVNVLISDNKISTTKPILNFSRNNLITGVTKVINGDSTKDLLIWTDDRNEVRCINIERCKKAKGIGLTTEDITLIKKPPKYSPKVVMGYSVDNKDNNLEDKFISFAYRYKYQDGEKSALSSFTNYKFAPSSFNLDYQTMENKGMVNKYNSMDITVNTGSKNVVEVDIVFKESNSNTIYLLGSYNKSKESWGDNQNKTIKFTNSKKYIALPESELFRLYDNIPRKGKTLDMVGNRLMIANYLEGYDLKDSFGQNIHPDYYVSLNSQEIIENELPKYIGNGELWFSVQSKDLKEGNRLIFDVWLSSFNYGGLYSGTNEFVLNRNFSGAGDLANSADFKEFVEIIMTNKFKNEFIINNPEGTTISSVEGYTYRVSGSNIVIKAPLVNFRVSEGEYINDWFSFEDMSEVLLNNIPINTSLKSNRSYETGIIYLDPYNRATTALVSNNNTIYVPQEFSGHKNQLEIKVNNNPPSWADRYKFVIKQNREDYETIYVNTFYEEGLFRWVKLEGENINKVKVGDNLIVKSDIGGKVSELITTKVLEITSKEKDFIENNENEEGVKIIEESGIYMKIKPVGFDMNFNSATHRTFENSSHRRYTGRVNTLPEFTETDGTNLIQVPAGSTVRIYIKFEAWGKISYLAQFDKTYKVNSDYETVEQWFNTEVRNLGSFGREYTKSGGDSWNRGSGWGFTDGGKNFWVRAHRDGTASRKITTDVKFEVKLTDGTVIFETEPREVDNDIYYETEETFDIVNGRHMGNISNQTTSSPAICRLDFFNCYTQQNGAESYKVKDSFNGKRLSIDLRPTSTSEEPYKETRRYSEITYSEPYNENNNVNGLNNFNLSKANYKEDIDKKYGSIQKIFNRNTDVLVFQENKVSRVLYGKDILSNMDGTTNLASVPTILGSQIPYDGEYGISLNPESFSYDGFNVFFSDSRRGVILRLNNTGINVISELGMRQYFKSSFSESKSNIRVGSVDPYRNEYYFSVIDNTVVNIPDFELVEGIKQIEVPSFKGEIDIVTDVSMYKGKIKAKYETNGVPLEFRYSIDGQEQTTSFVGDSVYDSKLLELGYSPTVGGRVGEIEMYKDINKTPKVNIKAFTPFNESGFVMDIMKEVEPEKSKVVMIVKGNNIPNTNVDTGFSWSIDGFSSSRNSEITNIKEGEDISRFDVFEGVEGQGFIPKENSTVVISNIFYKHNESEFKPSNFKYLQSNEDYTSETILNVLNQFTTVSSETKVFDNGDIMTEGKFQYNRGGFSKLYLLSDIDEEVEVKGTEAYCEENGTVVVDILALNGLSPDKYEVEIMSLTNRGESVVENNKIKYTNLLYTDKDFVTFRLKDKTNNTYSNTAKVDIFIYKLCGGSFDVSTNSITRVKYNQGQGSKVIGFTTDNTDKEAEVIVSRKGVEIKKQIIKTSDKIVFDKTEEEEGVYAISVRYLTTPFSINFTVIC